MFVGQERLVVSKKVGEQFKKFASFVDAVRSGEEPYVTGVDARRALGIAQKTIVPKMTSPSPSCLYFVSVFNRSLPRSNVIYRS
jgi:hypothetical protein